MVRVNVEAGTNAGHRIVKLLEPWTHECSRVLAKHPADTWDDTAADITLPGERYSCPYCGARRPNDG